MRQTNGLEKLQCIYCIIPVLVFKDKEIHSSNFTIEKYLIVILG